MKMIVFKPQYGKTAFVLTGLTKEQNTEAKKILQAKGAIIEKAAKKDGTYYIIYNPDTPDTPEVTKVKAAMSTWGSYVLVPYDDFLANATATADEAGFVRYNSFLLGYTGSESVVEIPDGTEEICDNAFGGNEVIEKVHCPDTLKRIGDSAFYGCPNLTSVELPEGLEEMGSNVFDYCGKLSSLNIPAGLSRVGVYNFEECGSLKEITVPNCITEDQALIDFIGTYKGRVTVADGNKHFCSTDDGVFNREFTTVFYPGAKDECLLPDTVTSIGDSFFNSQPSFRKLTLPEKAVNLTTVSRRFLFNLEIGHLLCAPELVERYYNSVSTDKNTTIDFAYKLVCGKVVTYNNGAEKITKELFKKYRDEILNLIIAHSDADALAEYLKRIPKVTVDTIDELAGKIAEKAELASFLEDYKNLHFTKAAQKKAVQDRADKEAGLMERTPAEWKKIFMLSNVGEDGVRIEKYKGSDDVAAVPAMIGKKAVVGINLGRFLETPVRLKLPNSLIIPRRPLKSSEIVPGGIVEFGQYFSEGNSITPIRWKVLSVKGNEALLLSERVIDYVFYHRKREAILWDECDMRKWLGNTFFSFAFTPEEQQIIIDKELSTLRYTPGFLYNSKETITTHDRVFLLSIDEVNEYLPEGEREASPTLLYCDIYNHVNAKYSYLLDINPESFTDWVLRSGATSGNAAVSIINRFGDITGGRITWVNSPFGVRPAIWISIGG